MDIFIGNVILSLISVQKNIIVNKWKVQKYDIANHKPSFIHFA